MDDNKMTLTSKLIAFVGDDIYHRPVYCDNCDEVLIFYSPGRYKCEKCNNIQYDDYGKVREYLYDHRGATAEQVSEAVGVNPRAIRQMLKEEKIEEINSGRGRLSTLSCIKCMKPISSGKMCLNCMQTFNKKLEEEAKREKIERRKEANKDTRVITATTIEQGRYRTDIMNRKR